MTVFDRVKKLADEQKISITELEERLGFGKNSLYSWKKKVPNAAGLQKIADYFNVSTDYLLGRSEVKRFDDVDFDDDDLFLIQRARKKMSDEEKKRFMQVMKLTFVKAFEEDDDDEEDF
ncbi:helix-turn-helix domain-containing protein [Jeotgalibacillus salarius]|uniref:XRE family transcriptional regulator n=1 Tax=Jeotgalibacillus salarius TaxID=546023 RepID=A0A4Y8LIM9_9BACL|nr:helix-turn-helix transcriptional regulator [Jeotgalibacillus salarius]TFE02856.1 XRE family transcriptional regulator [Jeotgalibacillus salarius]